MSLPRIRAVVAFALILGATVWTRGPLVQADSSRQIVFTGCGGSPYGCRQYVVADNTDGTGAVPITSAAQTTSGGDSDQAWSPDGTRIAFNRVIYADPGTNQDARGTALFVMDANGQNVVQLTQPDALPSPWGPYYTRDHHPSWSPTGDSLVFERFDPGPFTGQIRIVSVASGSGSVLVDGHRPDWSPVSNRIVFQSNNDYNLYTVDANGSNLATLTLAGLDDIQPEWSPDGSQVVYHRLGGTNAGVYVVDADGSNPHLVLADRPNIYATFPSPKWSPDGTRIAAIMSQSCCQPFLVVVNADGTDLQNFIMPGAAGLSFINSFDWQGPSQVCGAMTFGLPSDLGAGTSPQQPATGDLNQDGRSDIVVPNYDSSSLTVWLSTGSGFTAAPGSPLSVPTPYFAAIADFTGDSFADIAVATGHSVAVFPGHGDGTFSEATITDITVTSGLRFAAADLNSDGNIDLALSAVNGQKAAVWHGVGDGTFQFGQEWSGVGTWPSPVAIADLNGDSRPDFAVGDAWNDASGTGSFVYVFLQLPAGGYAAPIAYETYKSVRGLALADVNGDTHPDIVAPNYYGHGFQVYGDDRGTVTILAGSADGTFGAPTHVLTGASNPDAVAVVDIDHDGVLDIVTSNQYTPPAVSILRGDGLGGFAAPALFTSAVGAHPTGIAAGDFDANGLRDLVWLADYTVASSGLKVMMNQTSCVDVTPPVITPTVSGPLGSAGWYLGDTTVSWAVTDAESTISSTSGCDATTITTDTSGLVVTCSATSRGGTSTASVTIKRDATPPGATATATPPPNANNWRNTDVTVSFSGTDALSGGVTCDSAVVISTQGTNLSASGRCLDAAGNQSALATAAGINIDTTPPTAVASAGPPPNANGWRKTNVTVSFSGSDALSGGVTCDPQVVISTEGLNQSASGRCRDAAGNASALATASGINIDKTNPTAPVSVPIAGTTYNRGQVVNAQYACLDVLSDIAAGGCVGTVASGQPIDTSKKANNAKFTVNITDRAGNTAKATVTYSVR